MRVCFLLWRAPRFGCLSVLDELLFFSFPLGKAARTGRLFTRSLSLSSIASKYKRNACMAPTSLSLSLSLSRFFLVYTPSSPLPSLFFLTVKAAFQMLISTQSKRERGSGVMASVRLRFRHIRLEQHFSQTNTYLSLRPLPISSRPNGLTLTNTERITRSDCFAHTLHSSTPPRFVLLALKHYSEY